MSAPAERPSEPRAGRAADDAEPAPLAALAAFEEGDFRALSAELGRDPQYNDRRLLLRRKLGALGKAAARRLSEAGPERPALDLAARTSLHAPHAFNAMRVRRQWVYLARSKAQKTRLRRTLGAELARDLDAAYRNAYLCIAVEADALEASLRIHPDAWYDGQNLKNRLEREPDSARGGLGGWLGLLNALPGYRLRLDDWKGEWPCGALDRDRLREFLKYWKPGELGLAVERRFPAPEGARGAVLDPGVPAALLAELERLAPLYAFAAWSDASPFLFAG